MSIVKFTSTLLATRGKKGVLPPDADGYYEVILGGLNAFNSVGDFYCLEGAKDLFEQSSALMRRIQNGCLKGELGHPKYLPGMTDEDYFHRILDIYEDNVAIHIKEVWIDLQYGRNHPEAKNPNLVAVMGKVKPSGPKGPSIKESLDNPNENVCFSIRSLTEDIKKGGIKTKIIRQIICWDVVIEPGISISTQWNAPSLEHLVDRPVTKDMVEHVVSTPKGIGNEASLVLAKEALTVFEQRSIATPPSYLNWV